jgi:hypothetical protein
VTGEVEVDDPPRSGLAVQRERITGCGSDRGAGHARGGPGVGRPLRCGGNRLAVEQPAAGIEPRGLVGGKNLTEVVGRQLVPLGDFGEPGIDSGERGSSRQLLAEQLLDRDGSGLLGVGLVTDGDRERSENNSTGNGERTDPAGRGVHGWGSSSGTPATHILGVGTHCSLLEGPSQGIDSSRESTSTWRSRCGS